MPIGMTSGPWERTANAVALAATVRPPIGVPAACTLALPAVPTLGICVDLPDVRPFRAEDRPATDKVAGSGHVRRTPGVFRLRKGFGRSPHFPGKSRNSGQNTSQRTFLRSPEFLVEAGAERRLYRVATTTMGGLSGPRTRARRDPFSRPRPRAPPPA